MSDCDDEGLRCMLYDVWRIMAMSMMCGDGGIDDVSLMSEVC